MSIITSQQLGIDGANGVWPYSGPAPIFWTEIDPDTGAVIIIPIQQTPPGGEPYLSEDYHAETVGHYQDPPFSQDIDQQHVESGIFDVKPEGFIQEWEGPWLPDVEILGPPMTTPLVGGHAAAVVFDPLSEFGQGREPAFLYAHYEVDQSPNDYFRMGQNMRFGGKPLDAGVNPQAVLYEDIQDQSQTEYQLAWAPFRNRGGGRHNVVVGIPPTGSVTGNLSAVPNAVSLNDLMPDTTDAY